MIGAITLTSSAMQAIRTTSERRMKVFEDSADLQHIRNRVLAAKAAERGAGRPDTLRTF
jgi:hypothetical protein